MIKIFRRHRKKVLNKGNLPARQSGLKRYLIYAVGEILLVMIGILLALQINNWNEKQKEQKKVRIALTSLHEELVKDSLELHAILNNVRRETRQNQQLLDRAYQESTNLDTLVGIVRDEFSVLWVAHLKYSRSTFDNLKSTGSFESLPEPLKLALTDFYTTQDYWHNIISQANLEYQNRYEEFSKTYNLIGSKDAKKRKAYVFQSTWEDINPKHFVPRAISMIGAKNVLWGNFQDELESVQLKTRSLLTEVKPYLRD